MEEKLEYTIVQQKWEESERGWGIRPDGSSYHLTVKDCEKYIKDYWDSMPKSVPEEYSRPNGAPFLSDVTQELYEKIKSSKNGIRLDG